MHLANGQAAPCMGGGAWVGAQCWLGGRGRGLFVLGLGVTCDFIIGSCYLKWIWFVCFVAWPCDVIIGWLPHEAKPPPTQPAPCTDAMHHPCTGPMHGPAYPSSQTQIPAQQNLAITGLHHTAATNRCRTVLTDKISTGPFSIRQLYQCLPMLASKKVYFCRTGLINEKRRKNIRHSGVFMSAKDTLPVWDCPANLASQGDSQSFCDLHLTQSWGKLPPWSATFDANQFLPDLKKFTKFGENKFEYFFSFRSTYAKERIKSKQ